MFYPVYGFMVGFIVDNLGVRWTLIIGVTVQSASKLGLAFVSSSSAWALNLLIFFLIPFSEAMCIPVLNTAVRYLLLPVLLAYLLMASLPPFTVGAIQLLNNVPSRMVCSMPS